MSYRELRNFTESLRALGYPRLISMESFRQPNFELVADVLAWLVKRYDPASALEADQTNSEDQRVQFLKLAQQIVFSKARIRLNAKKLYSADGHAVHELLKLATILRRSMEKRQHLEAEQAEGEASELDDPNGSALAEKVRELKKAKMTAATITGLGRNVHELLSTELEHRETRMLAVAKPLDTETAQREIARMTKAVREEIDNLQRRMANVDADERNLGTKIEKKKAELERLRTRLQSLQSVRPAFMDEYETLEVQLASYFGHYLEKVRNVEYMEHELARLHREEVEQYERSKQKMLRAGRKNRGKRRGGGSPSMSGSDSESDYSSGDSESDYDDEDDYSGSNSGSETGEEDYSEGEEGEEGSWSSGGSEAGSIPADADLDGSGSDDGIFDDDGEEDFRSDDDGLGDSGGSGGGGGGDELFDDDDGEQGSFGDSDGVFESGDEDDFGDDF
jgi:clusterin-associated protein 1